MINGPPMSPNIAKPRMVPPPPWAPLSSDSLLLSVARHARVQTRLERKPFAEVELHRQSATPPHRRRGGPIPRRFSDSGSSWAPHRASIVWVGCSPTMR
jgi:hypothetical protein